MTKKREKNNDPKLLKEGEYRTSNKGRKCRWNSAQKKLLDDAVTLWHNFACVAHKDLDGGHAALLKWKRDEANRLLCMSDFSADALPESVSDLYL